MPAENTTESSPRSPGATKAPVWVTVTLTVRAAAGAGEAVSVKLASVPSVTAAPGAMLMIGRCAVPTSSLVILTEALPAVLTPPPPSPRASG